MRGALRLFVAARLGRRAGLCPGLFTQTKAGYRWIPPEARRKSPSPVSEGAALSGGENRSSTAQTWL